MLFLSRNKFIAFSVLAILLFGVILTVYISQLRQTKEQHASGPAPLSIKVVGNQLVNGAGQPIRLFGVGIGAAAPCINSNPPIVFRFDTTDPTYSITAAGMASWHINVARIGLNEDCWLGINGISPTFAATYQSEVVKLVNMLHTQGIYAIVDLHLNAPGSNLSVAEQTMADADHALTYWTSLATTFKNDPAVIFDAYNEPHITSQTAQAPTTTDQWNCLLNGCTAAEYNDGHSWVPMTYQTVGMQQIVNTIRATGATNVLMIGGLRWANDDSQLLQYLPKDPLNQLAASTHNYGQSVSQNEGCGPGGNPPSGTSADCWDTQLKPIAQQMPLITGEFGSGGGAATCATGYATEYMNWADSLWPTDSVSYSVWKWDVGTCAYPAILSDWQGTPNSPYGQLIHDHYVATNTGGGVYLTPQPTIQTPTPTNTPIPTCGPVIPCRVFSPTPTGIPSNTPTPSPQPTPTIKPGDTSFAITVCPHGLGNCGDNVSPNHGGNINPIHKIRTAAISVFDATNHQVGQGINSIVVYDPFSQTFQGIADMSTLSSGQYTVAIKMDGFLARQIPGIVTVMKGQQITLPEISLITGDIAPVPGINNEVYGDNQLDISDYNVLISCFGQKMTTASCPNPPTQQYAGADINDDGVVDGADYNEFLRELSVQQGAGGDSITPAPTQTPSTPAPTAPVRQPTPTPTNSIVSPVPTGTYQTQITKNIKYGPQPSEVLDQCLPVGAPSNRPGIIMIHGGGWTVGDKAEFSTECSQYASEGYVATTINYRLTPTYQWPDQIGDIQLAVRYMRSTASQTGLDVNRLCSDGRSAGGHLSLLLDTMQTIHQSDVSTLLSSYSPKVRCVIDQFGPADLTKLYNENPAVQSVLTNLLDTQTPASNPSLYLDASPVQYITAQSGQALIVQGTQDKTVLPDQSTEVQADLQKVGIPVQYISYNGGHGYGGLTQQQINDIDIQINAWLLSVEHP